MGAFRRRFDAGKDQITYSPGTGGMRAVDSSRGSLSLITDFGRVPQATVIQKCQKSHPLKTLSFQDDLPLLLSCSTLEPECKGRLAVHF